MSLRSLRIVALLSVALGCLTGFTWGFGDACKDAVEASQKIPFISDEAKRTSEEEDILRACPEGAAAQFIEGLKAERQGHVDVAIAAYRRALQIEPQFSVAQGNLGLLYLARGRQDEGVVELTRAVAGQPVPAFHTALARIMAEKRLFSLAHYHYSQASLRAPSDPEIMTGEGDVYAAQGQTSRAIDEYKRALFVNPQYEAAAIGLARVYLQQSQPEAGLAVLAALPVSVPATTARHLVLADLFDRAGDTAKAAEARARGGKKPEPPPAPKVAPCAKADQLAADGKIEKAIDAYRAALRQQPDSLEGHEKLGNLYYGLKRYDDALKSYQKATLLGTKNADVYYNLGQIHEKRNNLDEAVVSYKQAIERYPAFADARLRLADIRIQRGNPQDAIEQLTAYLKVRPDDAEVHVRLARLYGKQKSFNQAEQSYLQVLRLKPDHGDVHREIAGIYRTKGVYDKALSHYKKALAAQPADTESRNAIIAIYVKDKKYDDLMDLLKEAVRTAPEDPNNHYKLGLIYDFKKDHDNAIESYKKAIEVKADHAKALHSLGRVYMKTGRLAEAREALEAAKKADPNMEEASVLLNNIRDEFNPVPRKISDIKGKKGKKSKKGSKTSKSSKSSKKTSSKKSSSKQGTTKKTATSKSKKKVE